MNEEKIMEEKLGIWGWWQGNNLGDNWIKRTLGVFFPSADFLETSVRDFRDYDFIICGGGGLFIYDVISPWNDVNSDTLKGLSYGILGMGAEFPHNSDKAKQLCNKSKFFYVRDQYSLGCMRLSDMERSYDLTFAVLLPWLDKSSIDTRRLLYVWRDGHELVHNDQFNNYIGSSADKRDWDSRIGDNFSTIAEDDFQTRDSSIEDRFSNIGFVISGRYHGIVAAIHKGLPFIAIDICPKIRALLKECQLEKYCIKISEFEKLDELIFDARAEIDKIREKEFAYRNKANAVLIKQLKNVKLEVLKALHPLNIIHYGSYWMKENDVVSTMSDDLGKVCNVKKFDLQAYSACPDRRIKQHKKTPNGLLCMLETQSVINDISECNADAVILNSGGLYLDDAAFQWLKKNNTLCIGISLSDPDVFPYNGKVYADKFDLFYTNSKYSLDNEYDRQKVNIGLLPFAASVDHHFYMPDVEKKYDIVVVAHAREDRIPVIDKLNSLCHVGTYGRGWKNSLGVVNGHAHVHAINTGKMYLSFARTVAGFDNVKVGLFEAMACNQVVLTSYMEELQDYFDIGSEIICYKSEEELYEVVEYYLKHEDEREKIRRKGYQKFLRCHTYEKRWNDVMKDIYIKKGYCM